MARPRDPTAIVLGSGATLRSSTSCWSWYPTDQATGGQKAHVRRLNSCYYRAAPTANTLGRRRTEPGSKRKSLDRRGGRTRSGTSQVRAPGAWCWGRLVSPTGKPSKPWSLAWHPSRRRPSSPPQGVDRREKLVIVNIGRRRPCASLSSGSNSTDATTVLRPRPSAPVVEVHVWELTSLELL